MSLQINTNVKPYYDDFDEDKNYYRVMYKPGFPVQAREVTTTQSILQDQIEKLASRILAIGDQVVPGEFNYNPTAAYVRCASITTGSEASEYVGYNLTGAVSGVTAHVELGYDETDDDDTTFYVKYLSGGDTSEYSTFIEGETLTSDNPNFYTATVGVNTISKPIDTPPLGFGSTFTVEGGSYFVDGFIVRNDEDTIIIDKYDTNFTGYVGFLVTEEFVTASEDTSLLDNAQGSSNFAAPGADRLRITLKLEKLLGDEIVPNFISLTQIVQGNLQGKPEKTVKWDWLYDILAQRTFDESGDYIVSDFKASPMEYINREFVDGLFDVDPDTGKFPPIPDSGDLDPITFEEADQTYVIDVSAGLVYVQGYQVGYKNSFYLYGNKPRTPELRPNSLVPIGVGPFFTITSVSGTPDIMNIEGDAKSLAFEHILMYRNFLDGYVGQSTINVDAFGETYEIPINRNNDPWTTQHVVCDANIGTTQETVVYKEGNTAVLVSSDTLKRGDTVGGATILQAIEIKPIPAGMMTPRYHVPNQVVGIDDQGFEQFSSTYNLGVMTSTYFTEIAVLSQINEDVDWIVGDFVVGEESGAFGIVEEGSEPNLLLLSNISGDFRNGEEVTQDSSNKSAFILRAGDAVRLEFYDKGINLNTVDLSGETSIVCTSLGNTKELTAGVHYTATASELVLTQEGRDELLAFPFSIDNTFSRVGSKIKISVETVPNGVKGYVVVTPAKITHSAAKTKSFYSPLNSINKFSADISTSNSNDVEGVRVAEAKLFSGVAGDSFLICDDSLGDASEQLVAGDVISFSGANGQRIKKLVYFVTKPASNGNFEEPCTIFLTTALTEDVVSQQITRQRIKTKGEIDENLLIQLPEQVVKSIESNTEKTGIEYQFARQFYITVQAGATSFTLETIKENEYFVTDSLASVVIANNLSSPSDSEQLLGRYLGIDSKISQDGGHKMTINLTSPLKAHCVIKVITTCFIANAQAARKFLVEKTIVVDTDEARKAVIPLGEADGYRLVEVVNTQSGRDLTEEYDMDDGQRANYYDIASLVRRPSTPQPNAPLKITFQYLEHRNDGDFFSVDSYTHDEGVPYGAIPTFSSKFTLGDKQTVEQIELRDCIDFRPIVNTAPPFESQLAIPTDGIDAQSSKNFRDTSVSGNAFAPRVPTPGSQFQCDIEHYLPKIDSIFVLTSGEMTIIEGEPSSKPVPPSDITEGIRLFDIILPPYTFDANTLKLTKYNYHRYRMKDIHNLDQRITRLEEVFTLSLLENSALGMSVRDAVTGLDRFKNAFIVDSFADHSRGDVINPYYKCSIDPKQDHLRAPHFTDQAEMEDVNFTAEQRLLNGNYVVNDGIATVPFDSVRQHGQPYATRWINLQPYVVFTWQGTLTLDPPIDTFKDETRLPKLVIQDNSLYDAMQNLRQGLHDVGVLGTVWGDWESNTTSQRRRTSTRSTRSLGRSHYRDGSPDGSPGNTNMRYEHFETTVTTRDTTLHTTTRTRTQQIKDFNIGSTIEETSYGDKVVDVSLAETMRARAINVTATRMKPNTRVYLFFDDVDVTPWFTVDRKTTQEDGTERYDMVPNNNPGGFGQPIVTDDVGNLSGVFIIPNGRPPVPLTLFNGVLSDVAYQTEGPTRSFTTGTKTLRFTSNSTNMDSKKIESTVVDTYAQTNFTASGVITDKQETVVSTRVPSDFEASVREGQTQREVTTIETFNGETSRSSVRVHDHDPICQTFLIDGSYPNGVFVTEIDLFFRKKDPVTPVEVFLVNTEGGAPVTSIIGSHHGKVLPHSEAVLEPDTQLRVKVELISDSETFTAGTTFVGQTSGASAILKSQWVVQNSDDNPDKNDSNHTYTIFFDNYLNEFVPGEQIVPQINPQSNSTFEIVQDEVTLSRIDMTAFGSGYDEDTVNVVISEPDLPGGINATAVAKVANGMVYEVTITDSGSGYLITPSVEIFGGTQAATAIIRTTPGIPGVKMGVATSEDGSAPTKFKFKAPVYLIGNNTTYAFCAYAPNSTQYECFTARLGENQIGTENRVIQQDTSGSLYKSQNGSQWTEDQNEDINYTLYRANFRVNVNSVVKLQNAPLGRRQYTLNPIETNDTEVVGGTLSDVVVSFPGNAGTTTLVDGSYTNVSVVSTDSNSMGKYATINFDVAGGLVVNSDSSPVVNNPGIGYQEGEVVQVDGIDAQFTLYVAEAPSTVFGYNPRICKIYHDYHGHVKGDFVQLQNVVGEPGGLNNSYFNRIHEVVDADLQCFTVMLEADAETTEKAGGNFVMGSYNRPYEVINVLAGLMTFPTTTILAQERSIDSAGVTLYNSASAYIRNSPNIIKLEESFYHSGPKLVANELNEVKYGDDLHLRGEKSLLVSVQMSTQDPYISPVLDVTRTNSTIARNLIDKPNPNQTIYGATTRTVSFNDDIPLASVMDKSFLYLNAGNKMRSVRLESYNSLTRKLKLSGDFTNVTIDDSMFSDNPLSELGIRKVTDTLPTNFYPETQNNGSTFAKFISKAFLFENTCDGIKIELAASMFDVTDLRIFYKLKLIGSEAEFGSLSWVPFNPDQLPKNPDIDVEGNPIPVPGMCDQATIVKVRSSDIVDPAELVPGDYLSYKWETQDLSKFDGIQIKIVMSADNPAKAPIIDDMQLVCSE